MGNSKGRASAEHFRIDTYRKRISARPLFGLQKLLRIERGKWNGVLHCDNVTSVTDTVVFSKSNARRTRFQIGCNTSAPAFLGEPRLNVVNEASEEDLQRFHDEGREFEFDFTPEKGKTYSLECDIYRPVEMHHGGGGLHVAGNTLIASCILQVDLSAYAKAGYLIGAPLCVFETSGKPKGRGRAAGPQARCLVPRRRGVAEWEWEVRNASGGALRAAWRIVDRRDTRRFGAIDLDRLATELSLDARVAKDLHNFVNTCYFYAADFRSMNEIERRLVTSRSALSRSLESIEELIGAELIERTRGKGLVQITPAGEAVLEWWSRFYMRWTPIARDSDAG